MKLKKDLYMRPFLANVRKLRSIFYLLILFAGSRPYVHANTQIGIGDVKIWVKENFAKGKVPPFSFTYGNQPSALFIKKWSFAMEKLPGVEQDVEKYVYTYKDPKGMLTVKCYVTIFSAFQAVEWVLKIANTGKGNTPLLENVRVADRDFSTQSKGSFILHHAKGSNAGKDDFMPLDDTLSVGKNIRMTPAAARGSSDATAFPFFNIESPGESGVMVAIGWTGKWYAEIAQKNDATVSLRTGMERMKLTLYAGEEIRTPSVCLLFWQGADRMIGHNTFRKFILAHHSRKINGKFAMPPIAAGLSRGGPSPCNEFTCLTESYALATVERLKQFNMLPEVCWVDAGWYPGGSEWWEGVGNWFPDKARFPNGLKPITDAVHKAGSQFLLWFEPERVRPGTQIHTEHPEWCLYGAEPGKKKKGPADSYLFDLGNKDARIWLTAKISDFLEKEGIDHYRQDFNAVDAEAAWKAKDGPDRTGMAEIRHIEGLYAFWDSLLERFPNLTIDNCASGGRRLDLETVSRSVALWRSDYGYGEPDGYQNHTYGLNFYLPLHSTGLFNSSVYDTRSSLASSVVFFWDIHSASSSIPKMQRSMRDFKQFRSYFFEDYYPLTKPGDVMSDQAWLAYQLNRPAGKDGIVVAFRRKNCNQESIDVKLRGVNEESTYELADEDTGVKIIKKGRELQNGIKLALAQKQSSLILVYRVVKE